MRNISHVQMKWKESFNFQTKVNPNYSFNHGNMENKILSHLDYGFNLCSQGAPKEALEASNTILKMVENHSSALNLKAVSLWVLKQYKEALKCITRAFNFEPGNKSISDNYAFMKKKCEEMNVL
jgi:tetratricopeptide (TPR) repeat protein